MIDAMMQHIATLMQRTDHLPVSASLITMDARLVKLAQTESFVFRNSSTCLSFMAQLARALFGHVVSWDADKRVLDDLRGAQSAMVSVGAFLPSRCELFQALWSLASSLRNLS